MIFAGLKAKNRVREAVYSNRIRTPSNDDTYGWNAKVVNAHRHMLKVTSAVVPPAVCPRTESQKSGIISEVGPVHSDKRLSQRETAKRVNTRQCTGFKLGIDLSTETRHTS